MRSSRRRVVSPSALATAIAVGLLLSVMPIALDSQWLTYPARDVPRAKDGTPDLTAPAPRTADNGPDLSGIWVTAPDRAVPCGGGLVACGIELPMSREAANLGVSLPGGLPYQPWAAERVKHTAANALTDPHGRCLPDTFVRAYGLPHLLKFVQTPRLLVALSEYNAMYRQVHLDGRPLPGDPNPAWNGYSTGRWDGDVLVIDSNGFRDDLWLDLRSSPLTSAATVRERIRRPDFGHLEIEITVDDAKAYTRPWTATLRQQLVVDTEINDEICLENEKFMRRQRDTP
jgi:hypothetical protein